MCARRYIGANSAGDHWSPLLFVHRNFSLSLFPLRTISSREARPVIAAKANMPFLIERNSSVQSGGFLRAKALKSLFFGIFLFGRKERYSARREKTICKDTKVRLPYITDMLSEVVRLGFARRRIGYNSAGDRWSPLLFVHRNFPLNLFPLRTISSREARPVIAAKTNISFLIERNSSVQSGGFLRAQALKFPFFLVSFSFENERKRNSARSAETVCKDTKVRLPYITDMLSEEGRLEYARRRVGNNSAGDRWSPLLCVI